jgi:IS30 family transposase
MQYKQLSIEERELIQLSLWQKKSVRTIAKRLHRSVSTISREINKNSDSIGRRIYIPRAAHNRALAKRKSRGRQDRLKNDIIREYVIGELKKRTSPEQIAGRISKEYPGQSISHEAIYQFIYNQIHRDGWGPLKPGRQDLRSCLRRRKKRRTHKGMRRCQKMSVERGLSIDLRPKIVNRRVRIGDWESDTVASKDNGIGINTLVERKTGIVLITRLEDKTSRATVSAIESRIKYLPKELKQTATFDNGPENQKWQEIEEKTGLKCFFAHPYCSGERGTNENTNGLIRDYFPKKTDFNTITDEQLQEVESLLNNRPRKRLAWLTPLEVFSKELSKFNISINMPNVALVG